jgi:predicted lipid-binding transport protein (Tim44 family)
MRKAVYVSVIAIFVMSALCYFSDSATAARLGGGRSFGSRPGYQRSIIKPAVPPRPQQNNQYQQNGRVNTSPGGSFGGIGGLFAGGLIGSLLFGGMRGFTGPGLLDILLIGGILYMIMKFLQSRRMAGRSNSGGDYSFREDNRSKGYDRFQLESNYTQSEERKKVEEQDSSFTANPNVPVDFDEDEFLAGAKVAYTRLQESWNSRNLDDIRDFVSPEVLQEIKRQADEDLHPGVTRILSIDARLLEVKIDGSDTVASVYFDVLMWENEREETPQQIQEVWHFSRSTLIPKSSWILEGIQQVE